jgi:glycosyltransferase involved in cell wall biosynthesis
VRAFFRKAARGLYRKLPARTKTSAWFFLEDIRTAWYSFRRPALPGSLEERRKGPGLVFLYPPNVTWNHLFQRPHQMARALAALGHTVIFCTRDPGADGVKGFLEAAPGLYVTSLPPGYFRSLRPVLILSRPTLAPYLTRLPGATIVYDFIDELEVYEDHGPEMEREHARLLKEADVVLTTAVRLQEKALAIRPDAVLCPNGVDFDFFRHAALPGPIPDDLASIPRPRIGYYGALARWVDYGLIRFVARQRPEWNWVLIGPEYDSSLKESGLLESERNVFRLGHRPYEELPGYLRGFDVATIPFLVNEITRATSPVKLFEYLAGGKPVVTTAMDECHRYPAVMAAGTHEEFLDALERAIDSKPGDSELVLRAETARENRWDLRARLLVDSLGRLASEDRREPAGPRKAG